VHEFFGLTNHTGFTSVLLGGGPVSAAIQEVERVPGLSLMASGRLPPNPSELLSATSTEEVIGALRIQSDIVLVDSPPVLPVTDALVLAKHVDAILLVTAANITTGKELRRALELLDQVNAPVVGTVLNGVLPRGASLYDYRSEAGERPEGYRNSTLSAG
jgi:capsular exopolysaccharide synthesis family protein